MTSSPTPDLVERLQRALGPDCVIDRELGGGGMSRVFVATEVALGRTIVIKTLPTDHATPAVVERFQREIRVAARLQHPHIVPILATGAADDLPYYTMPFVKGETLRARLARSGEMAIPDTLRVLRDVASALGHAHAEGVVHRDIKPENILLSGGVAVVTDFGVAKAMTAAVDGIAGPRDPADALTSLGIALGTPAYMAPEQASADPTVDHRADIYAFGCVAYEMLTGSTPFAGRPMQQTLVAHVTEVPSGVAERRPSTPPALATLVMRCLEKRPGDRPQTAEELTTALDSVATLSGGTAPVTAQATVSRKRSRLGLLVGGVIAVLAGGVWAWQGGGGGDTTLMPTRTLRVAFSPDVERDPAISPDGKMVAYAVQDTDGVHVYVRQVDGGRATKVSGALTVYGNSPTPQWTPDGTRISFRVVGGIAIVAALGGEPQRIADATGDGDGPGQAAATHAWTSDGRQLVYAVGDDLVIRNASGGTARVLVNGNSPHSPSISPDGKWLAFSRGLRPDMRYLPTNSVWVAPMASGPPTRISDSLHLNVSPVWTPDGRHLLYVSDRDGQRDVYQQRVENGAAVGDATRLTTGLGALRISLSKDGTRLAHDVVKATTNIWSVAFSPTGVVHTENGTPFTNENQHIESMSVSPDAQWIAYDSDRSGNFDIWKQRLDGGEPVQLTTSPANDFAPKWSWDGTRIGFHSPRFGARDIFVVSADGGDEQRVTTSARNDRYLRWMQDGKTILYSSDSSGTDRRLQAMEWQAGAWRLSPLRLDGVVERGASNAIHAIANGLAYQSKGTVAWRTLDGKSSRTLADSAQLGGPISGMYAIFPDQSTVLVRSRNAIWGIPMNGSPPRKLVEIDATTRALNDWSTDGKRFFYTRSSGDADVSVIELGRAK